jgi:methionyl aminopeptidase
MSPLARLRGRKVVPQRSAGELDAMAAAGAVVANALQAVQAAAVSGVSTLGLDQIAESVIREAGAVPSFLGYHGGIAHCLVGFERCAQGAANCRQGTGHPAQLDIISEENRMADSIVKR